MNDVTPLLTHWSYVFLPLTYDIKKYHDNPSCARPVYMVEPNWVISMPAHALAQNLGMMFFG